MQKRTNEELQKLIDSLGSYKPVNGMWWYQSIEFRDGVRTHSHKMSDEKFYARPTFGMNKWDNYMRPNFPFGLKGKVILDLGSGSGLYLIQALREGAKFVYGIEPDHKGLGRLKQCDLVIDIFSEIDVVDYAKKIKIIPKKLHLVDWESEIERGVDLTLAANVLYWVTEGDYALPNVILTELLHKLASVSMYILVIGDQEVQEERISKGYNAACSGLATTIPYLQDDFDIEYFRVHWECEDRKPVVIRARSSHWRE